MKFYEVSGKKVLAGVGIILLLGVSAGCSKVEKFSWERLKETQYRMIMGKPLHQVKAAAAKPGEDITTPGTSTMAAGGKGAGESGKKVSQAKVDVVLYFADQSGDYLKAEKRQIQMVQGLAKATVEQLIQGPTQKGLTRTIPQGTKVREIDIKNGLCRIDLSKEFKENHWGGSSGEILTVYSLVDTLTQFDTVKQVEILIEGQRIDTLAGHMDLSAPVMKNTQIVKSQE
ncbi:MAG TPA: GerMN domain-containing protein [Desulfobacteria bacterium]|nr:GerMN domain-containing protein [Desulfobacteria bacterium]